MGLQPFDIVVVPFPYADRLAEKRRPAVVVSAPEMSTRCKLVWLVMITSAINPRWDCDVEITDLKKAGLPAPSRIRPAKIATADVGRIAHSIGELSANDRNALRKALRVCFAG